MTGSRKAALAGTVLLVLLACLARVVNLDADPLFPTWVGYIIDEGRWNESARNMVLFGHTNAFAERIHLLLSPAYQLVAFLAFKLNGVSLVSARLSAALAGCAIVLLVASSLRRHVSPLALAAGVLILGFETYMLAESRMALPEIPAALGMLACFLVLVLAPQTRRNAAIAGLVLVVALAMKGTMALVAPAAFAVALFHGEQPSWRARAERLLAFSAGAAVPVAAVLAAGLAAGVLPVEKLLTLGDRLLGFIRLMPGRDLLWQLFESQQQVVRNLLLLGAWCGSWIWLHRRPALASMASRLYLATAVWAGWSALIWAVNAYAPGRYVVHVIVPATLHLMAALSLGDRETPIRIEARLRMSSGLPRIAWLSWLVLPAAVITASLVVGLAALTGLDVTRVSSRVALISACTLALGLTAHRVGPGHRAVAMFMLAPGLAALSWYLGWELGLLRHFWEDQPRAATLLWLLVCGVALAVAALHGRAAPGRRGAIHAMIVLAAAAAMLARATPPLLTPTFTIRDASRELGPLLPTLTGGEVVVHAASSLFLENRLPYREIMSDNPEFDWLLTFEHYKGLRQQLQRFSEQPMERSRTFAFAVDPRYALDPVEDGPLQVVLLHRRPAPPARPGQPASAPGGVAR